MSSRIEKLLPGDLTAQEYFKYRRLLKGNPRDNILVKSYEVALAKAADIRQQNS